MSAAEELSPMQSEILRDIGRGRTGGVSKGLLARARRNPELCGKPGYTFLTEAVGLLDAGYFVEPTGWDTVKSAMLLRDESPAELTALGRAEADRIASARQGFDT